jgi:hypothetical protein
MGDSVCSYRNSLSQDLPYDYYLWQGGEACSGKKKKDSPCAPLPPAAPLSKAEIAVFERGKVRPNLKRLPADERQLEAFLTQLNRKGQIKWISPDLREIYAQLQGEIKASAPNQDVHIVMGMVHPGVDGQTQLINELLTLGKDKRKVSGVTHLALELVRINSSGYDSQLSLDQYLITGKMNFELKPPENWKGTNIPKDSNAETEAKDETFRIGYRECYNLVMSDNLYNSQKKVRTEAGGYSAREIHAVKSVNQRTNPKQKNVVVWGWGATHTEKHRLPFYIKIMSPKAKVVSVVVNGGTYVDAFALDRVLKRLGWLERPFILKLAGYRDADYIVHIPTKGRERMWGISKEGDPVIQHIVNPPY